MEPRSKARQDNASPGDLRRDRLRLLNAFAMVLLTLPKTSGEALGGLTLEGQHGRDSDPLAVEGIPNFATNFVYAKSRSAATRIRDYAVTRRIMDVGVRGAHPNLR